MTTNLFPLSSEILVPSSLVPYPIVLWISSSLWPRLLILWLHSLFLWPFDPQDIFFLPEPVFLNVYGAQEYIPRNEFRQPM
jgi:hypothetical protein